MEILSHLEQTIHSFEIVVEEKKYYYKEYLDDRGKLIDSELCDENGDVVDNKELADYISEQISY
jgi:hypothetical protein